jgi:hypothetical protein
MFTKQKTITVMTKDFIERDSLGHAEFTGTDGKPYLVQVVKDDICRSPREDTDYLWTWTTTRGAGYTDKNAIPLDNIVEYGVLDREFEKTHLIVKLYLFRHSGDLISMRRGYPFNDPWDAGCMGIAYLEKKKALEEYGWQKLTASRIKKLQDYLQGEITAMNAFNAGEVYGIMVTDMDSEKIDSCWGYICPDYKDLESCVSDQLHGYAENPREVAAEVMKAA